MKNKITVSAPGKLMLFGEHSVVYQKPCIVTAVDQRMWVFMEKTEGNTIKLTAPEVGIKDFEAQISIPLKDLPKGAMFVFASVKNFYKKFKVNSGLKIRTKSDFSSKFGFGSSSAVTVGVIKALSGLYDIKISNEETFQLAYKSVLDVQGVGSGFDIAAAIWGGTIYFVGGGKKIIPISKGNLPIIVGYSGIKADTSTLIKQVAELRKSKPKIVNSVFDLITDIVEEARQLLDKKKYKELGMLANINQGLLESLGINTLKLSEIIFAARSVGGYGAKLSGAGGGDCVICFSDNKNSKNVKRAIKSSGGTVMNVTLGAQGVKFEK